MNLMLKKQIISHIFKSLGIIGSTSNSLIDNLTSEKFLIDKKMTFENEENKKYENDIWAITTNVENSIVKIIIADITEDTKEFALILQMDNFMPSALRLSVDEDDIGTMMFLLEDNRWINSTTHLQAKILVGIESLSEIYCQWDRLDNYSDMYKFLIGFLNFYEQD